MRFFPSNQHGYGILPMAAVLVAMAATFPHAVHAGTNSSDPCAAIAGKKTASYSEAKACLDHFSFDQDRATQTLDTVHKVVNELYVFNEIAAAPPKVEGLSIVAVNISEGLDIIRTDQWSSDREFQEAIALLLDKVHDAHLSYSPFCYRQFVFWQPIQLNSLVRDQRSVINVAYIKEDIWSEAKSSWVGCEVTQIDGRDAWDMVMDYAANNNGESKDINTCYNNIMNTKDYFHGWDDGADDLGYHRFLPAQEKHSYTLKCGQGETEEVEVPWIAMVPSGFTDADSYWNRYCESSHAGLSKRDAAAKHYDLQELERIHDGQAFDLAPEHSAPSNEYVRFITLEDDDVAKVGVVDIQSFSVALNDLQTFIDNFTQGIEKFEKQGIEKIIIDLSANGGGDACVGEFIVNSFFNTTPDYPSDIKYTPFLERVINKAYATNSTKWSDYRAMGKQSTTTDGSWYAKTRDYKRGDQTVPFSQPVRLSCKAWESNLNGVSERAKTSYQAKDLLIMSDGRCGSTCAIIASRLRLTHNVAAMGVGGVRGNPMQFASFPGGESERLSAFLMDLQSLGLDNDPDAPNPFPTSADMGWTFREVYRPLSPGQSFSGEETDLLEYSVTNADCRLHFTDDNAGDVMKQWTEAARAFLNGECSIKSD